MSGKLHVANLSRTADGRNLEVLFAPHGTVRRAEVFTDPAAAGPGNTGLGRIEMGTDAEAAAAITALNGHLYCGRALEVSWAAAAPGAVPDDPTNLAPVKPPNAAGPYGIGGPAAGDFGDRGGSDGRRGGDSSGVAETIESDAEAAERLGARIEKLAARAGRADAQPAPDGVGAAPAGPAIRAADAAAATAARAAEAATDADRAAAEAGRKPAGEAMSIANRVAEQDAWSANRAADAAADFAASSAEGAD